MKFKDTSELVVTPLPTPPPVDAKDILPLTAQVLNETTSWPSAKTVNQIALGFGIKAQRCVHYAGKAKQRDIDVFSSLFVLLQ